jgi:hypothetical protein
MFWYGEVLNARKRRFNALIHFLKATSMVDDNVTDISWSIRADDALR